MIIHQDEGEEVGLTEGRGSHCLGTLGEVFASGDDGLGGAIAIDEKIHLVLVNKDVLVIDTGLDVDDKSSLVILGVGVDGVRNGFELAAAILSHCSMGNSSLSQEPSVSSGEPSGVPVLIKLKKATSGGFQSQVQVQGLKNL